MPTRGFCFVLLIVLSGIAWAVAIALSIELFDLDSLLEDFY